MEPSEIRARLLEDHAQLRAKAGVLESLALQVLRGDEDLASALRLKGEDLHAHLLDHMGWEDHHILPLLQALAPAAKSSVQALESEHRIQRDRLGDLLGALRDPREPARVARSVLDFARSLEQDMLVEENRLLVPAVLGDAERA